MKINDVEQILGITKANIRFYEKEGLLTPNRTEKGYRDYTEADLSRLKEIIIYRKLGIPVQQIADILDGILPLQDALDANITALNAEIKKLNGSLTLCHQLKAENARVLDAERYWDIIHQHEKQGMKFQSLLKDYAQFMEPTLDRYLLHVPSKHDRNPKMIIKYTALFTLGFGAINGLLTGNLIGGIDNTVFQSFYFCTDFLYHVVYCIHSCIPSWKTESYSRQNIKNCHHCNRDSCSCFLFYLGSF